MAWIRPTPLTRLRSRPSLGSLPRNLEPDLLAWRDGDEFLLRELTDDEALKLQQLCLACQAEEAARQESQVCPATAEAQLGLF